MIQMKEIKVDLAVLQSKFNYDPQRGLILPKVKRRGIQPSIHTQRQWRIVRLGKVCLSSASIAYAMGHNTNIIPQKIYFIDGNHKNLRQENLTFVKMPPRKPKTNGVAPEKTNEEYLYCSGPITEMDNCNRENFDTAVKLLVARGYDPKNIYNPVFMDLKNNIQTETAVFGADVGARRTALMHDYSFLCQKCTKIFMLPGFEKSRGAMSELYVAKAIPLEIEYLKESELKKYR